mgnify:CR=1 FL=1
MLVRIRSEHPKAEPVEKTHDLSRNIPGPTLDKICKSLRGVSSHNAYLLKRDKKVVYEDQKGWTHTITIEEVEPITRESKLMIGKKIGE